MARSAAAARLLRERLTALLTRRPFTLSGLFLLLISGGLGVVLHPEKQSTAESPQRDGLAQLLVSTQLLQGFRGDPSRPAPALWNQRLGLRRAEELWNRQGSALWWQAWSTDGEAYLVIPSTLLPASDRSGLTLTQVQGLLASAADPLHREQLRQRLRSASGSAPSSLQADCLNRLQTAPAVFWSSDGLASISGTLAPLLQRASHGCLSLALDGQQLRWQGVVGRRSLIAAPARLRSDPVEPGPQSLKLAEQALLSVRGGELGDVLGALFSRSMIQVPLEQDYGINQEARTLLATRPFTLQLLRQTEGLFQAGLELQIPLPGGEPRWKDTLDSIDSLLRDRGMDSRLLPDNVGVVFADPQRPDSPLVGGWRWIRDSKDNIASLLSIGLGRSPSAASLRLPRNETADKGLQLQARPRQMQNQQLLPGRWPKVVRDASQLELNLRPLTGGTPGSDWLHCEGRLNLAP